MKISVSIYSTDYRKRSLEALIRELDQYRVDLFHIDCMDDPKVFEDIRVIRGVSATPLDLHIISSDPSRYVDDVAMHQVEYVTFQQELLPDAFELPALPRSRVGVALAPETTTTVFDAYTDRADFVMFMATTPGQSGGVFDKATFRKIRRFKQQYPGRKIHVDGGVNSEVSFILRNMGVFASVSGSYVLQANVLGAALMDLRNHETESRYRVADFMMEEPDVPLLPPDRRSLKDVLESIERHNLGFTILVDRHGMLEGLIANADVRRGLLDSIDNVSALAVSDIINRSPVVVDEEATVTDLLRLVKHQRVPVTYLPVVNGRRQVTGAVTFFNLVDGEL